jgi:hypothetical protein
MRASIARLLALAVALAGCTGDPFDPCPGPGCAGEATGSVLSAVLIQSDEDARCLGTAAIGAGPDRCGAPGTSWRVDPVSKMIWGGPAGDRCLTSFGADGALVFLAAPATGCRADDPSSQWTFDPVARAWMSGWGFFLTWGTVEICDEVCSDLRAAVTARLPGRWGSPPGGWVRPTW